MNNVTAFLVAIVLYIIYLWIFTAKAAKQKKKSIKKYIKSIVFGIKVIVSLDWFSAHISKEKLKDDSKATKARYIKKRNYINLGVSIIIFIISLIPKDILFFEVVTILLIYRCISRSFELIFAFGKDVIEPKKYSYEKITYIKQKDKIMRLLEDNISDRSNVIEEKIEKILIKSSSLKSDERIKLAIISYIELNLNFSVLYHIINIAQVRNWLKSLALSLGNILYLGLRSIFEGDFLLYDSYTKSRESLSVIKGLYKSIGISTASGIGSSELGFFSALQSITVIVLVIFAITTYLGSDD